MYCRFLLAKLHFDLLVDALSARDIRDALENLPPQLTDTYKEMVGRINDQGGSRAETAFRTIAWIIFAKRPLKVKEIQHALAVRSGDTYFDRAGITNQDLIIQCCGGFVGLQSNDTLGFVHHTTQEYWMTRSRYGHDEIFRTCIAYLSFPEIRVSGYTTFETLIAHLQEFALLDYACRHWGKHYRDCADGSLQQIALVFCRDKRKALPCLLVIDQKESPKGYFKRILPQPPAEYTLGVSPMANAYYGLWLSAHFGLVELSIQLLEGPQFDLRKDFAGRNQWSNWDDYPLRKAFSGGFDDLVGLFTEKDADPTPINSAYLDTLSNRDTLSLCLSKFAQACKSLGPGTILHSAIQHGTVEAIDLLLKHTTDVNLVDEVYCKTPLHWAASRGLYDVAVHLLARGAKVDPRDILLDTPLHMAALNGHDTVVQLLLKHDADVNSQGSMGRTPLHYASASGHLRLAELLLRSDAHVDTKEASNQTPLYSASWHGHPELATLLLENGAYVDARDKYNRTPLHSAILNGKPNAMLTARVLLQHGADMKALDDYGTFTTDRLSTNRLLKEQLVERSRQLRASTEGYSERQFPRHVVTSGDHSTTSSDDFVIRQCEAENMDDEATDDPWDLWSDDSFITRDEPLRARAGGVDPHTLHTEWIP